MGFDSPGIETWTHFRGTAMGHESVEFVGQSRQARVPGLKIRGTRGTVPCPSLGSEAVLADFDFGSSWVSSSPSRTRFLPSLTALL